MTSLHDRTYVHALTKAIFKVALLECYLPFFFYCASLLLRSIAVRHSTLKQDGQNGETNLRGFAVQAVSELREAISKETASNENVCDIKNIMR